MSILVPNRFPLYAHARRLAIVGEAPGKDEVAQGRPFIGSAGRFLAALLSRAGMSLDACYLGNVCQYQPPNNDISQFSWSSDVMIEGIYQLEQDMRQFKPNLVVLLGPVPLNVAKRADKPNAYKISNWRGSLFNGGGPFHNLKCLATYHPAYCLRDYESTPLLQFDLRKAVNGAGNPLLELPQRTFAVQDTNDTLVRRLRDVRNQHTTVAIDIEGGIDCMSCISFATSPGNAFIVPIFNKEGNVVITPEVWRELALTLEDESVPKVLQNSLYDRFVLHYSYGIRVRGVVDDTMLKHWELYSELEKNLGLQTSLYTDEPYYKGDRKSQDDKTFYEYCCRDSAVTLEISNKLDSLLIPTSRQHYKLNIALLNPFLYMELRGIRYNVQGAYERRQALLTKLHERQALFNCMTGRGFPFNSLKEIQTHANQLFVKKNGLGYYKAYEEDAQRYETLLKEPAPGLATIGELEDLCKVSLNVSSQKQFQKYLYEEIKLPTQWSNKRGEEPHPTSDYEALLNLSRHCLQTKNGHGYKVCQSAIELRALSTRQRMLSINADKDGRIRCGYNTVGANTGRITCYESPTGSGYNLQTIPNYTELKDAPGNILGDRDLFLADYGHYMFQCDLAGADGWTVAAYCAMLGDPAMLAHYRAQIKPYWVIALKLLGIHVNFRDLDSIKAGCASHKLNDWEKLTSKRVQHGGAYLEGGLTISRNVLKDSEGKLYISPQECDKLKNWYIHEMYPGIPRWHEWIASQLRKRPVLVAASGQVRQFFGRPDEVLTKAVAFEPQANTTYATNLAAYRLWTDKENRVSVSPGGSDTTDQTTLRIEPLHQVHDALIGQFRIEDTIWAVGKIKSWFNNPLMIAGQEIIIPFDGAYGTSWGCLQKGKI